ncbi:DMT family transporter [Marinobacterium lutimaris]|uniref:EamA-like transporter family protein n=1 Tax=Marinobacterium lutimaris TaxID=568106 RepID=A0A1H5UW39_9GAMM|nr:DMT family transporter [Marinobacterium lutimaris]SEF79372.1 EamA-like transporter family protein [Marinobacterium lutimaris]
MNPSLLKAAALIVLSESMLVGAGVIIRVVSDELSTPMIVFMRNLMGLILMLPFLLRASRAMATKNIHLHLMRAVVGISAMSCLYYSWSVLPLGQAALLKQTAPFFVPVIAFWWLGEHVPARVKLALLVGFAGVALILNPQQGAINMGIIVALLGASLSALAKVTVRRMHLTEPPQRIVFYFALFGSLFSVVPAALHWVTPSPEALLWLLGLGAASTLAQLSLSRAYTLVPAAQLGPFTYSSVVLAAAVGWLLWDESIALLTIFGMLLVFAGGVLTLNRPAKTAAGAK